MKKFYFIFTCILMFCLVSCTCTKQEEIKEDFNAETLISQDCAYMDSLYTTYSWYETTVHFCEFFDSEDTNDCIETVISVFQAIVEVDSTNTNTEVITFTHTNGAECSIDTKHGFWVEDFPLDEETIVLTFKEAYEKLMETNCVKPHGKYCVLRKEVGPISANPQYVFGNPQSQVYVDVITGDVSTTNPVFPNSKE